MIKLVVFDLDGTLVDSRRDLATAANVLVTELGGAALREEAVGQMVGEGAGVLVRRALVAAGLRADVPGALPRFLEIYDQHLLDTTVTYEAVVETLERLHSQLPLAVLTNKPERATVRVLKGLELDRFFTVVIGGDSAHGRKPDPAGLLHIAQTCGVSAAETLLVGDSPVDLETARNAGTQICLVRYGFGFRSVQLSSTEIAIDSMRELPNLFRVPSSNAD